MIHPPLRQVPRQATQRSMSWRRRCDSGSPCAPSHPPHFQNGEHSDPNRRVSTSYIPQHTCNLFVASITRTCPRNTVAVSVSLDATSATVLFSVIPTLPLTRSMTDVSKSIEQGEPSTALPARKLRGTVSHPYYLGPVRDASWKSWSFAASSS